MTLLRWLLRLPLASLAGCGLALFAGVAWSFLAPTCGAATMAPFAGCAAPAILGLWIDPEPVIMGEAPIDVVEIVETDVPESLPIE